MIHNKFICSDYLIITFVQFVGFTASLMTIKLERLPLFQEAHLHQNSEMQNLKKFWLEIERKTEGGCRGNTENASSVAIIKGQEQHRDRIQASEAFASCSIVGKRILTR